MRRRTTKPTNLDFDVFEIEEIQIGEWTPERDGKGKTEQVHVMLKVRGLVEIPFLIRFKSREGVESFVSDLMFHANNVWPPAEGAS